MSARLLSCWFITRNRLRASCRPYSSFASPEVDGDTQWPLLADHRLSALCCKGSRGQRQALIVNARWKVADFDPPSSATTSQGPSGGVVCWLTAISHVTLVGFERTFVPTI